MKRVGVWILAGSAILGGAGVTQAQIGANLFPRPSIAGNIHPVVGRGAAYETTHTGAGTTTKDTQELTVVGHEVVNEKEAFWFEFARPDRQTGKPSYGKVLFTKDDFQIHRLVVQRDGQAAMEIPFHPGDPTSQRIADGISKWEPVGAETITVPAGTFVCQHWKSSGNEGGEIWTNEQVSPFGLVKEVSPTRTMVLIKLITEATDHITGPVKQFDPQALRQEMIERRQQRQQQPN